LQNNEEKIYIQGNDEQMKKNSKIKKKNLHQIYLTSIKEKCENQKQNEIKRIEEERKKIIDFNNSFLLKK
jgi:hypothetical protein